MINNKCFICNTDNSEKFITAQNTLGITEQKFTLYKCKNCGLVFLNPFLDYKELETYYPEDSWGTRGNKLEGYYRDFIINRELKMMLGGIKGKGKRLLDVGSGTGEFLYHAKKLGFEVYGLETSKHMVKYSKETFGLPNILDSDLLSASYPEEYFDVILCNQVLEHLTNPFEYLKEVKRILKKDGNLVIQGTNISSYQFKMFREKWWGLSLPQHIYLFNPETITLALKKAGFNVSNILYHSIRNSTSCIYHTITGLNSHTLGKKSLQGKSIVLEKMFILFLSWFFLPFTLLEGWLKKGSIITIYAKKNNQSI